MTNHPINLGRNATMSNVQVQDGSGHIAAEAHLVKSAWERFWDKVLPPALIAIATTALLLWRNDTLQDRALKELEDESAGHTAAAAAIEKTVEDNEEDAEAKFYGVTTALEAWNRQKEIDRAQDEQLRAFDAWQDSQREQSARMLALMEKWDVQVDANARDIRAMLDRITRLEERADRAADAGGAAGGGGGPDAPH